MGERFRLRGDGLEWRTVEGELVALDISTESYLGVNRAGTLLWPALAEGASHEELVQKLMSHYEIDRTQADGDVTQFIRALQDQGLLESVSS